MNDEDQKLKKESRSGQMRRRKWLKLSFMLFVVLPTLFGTIYTSLIASDRYVTTTGFAVRTMKSSGSPDFLGAFTGLAAGGSTTADAYMILEFMKSRDLLDRLQQDFDFRAVYGSKDIDFVSRLWADRDVEKVVRYWNRRLQTSFDSTAGIIHFEVQGFTPEDSKRIAELVLGYAHDLVNTLSEQARADSVAFAEGEVARAEARQLDALRQIRDFRKTGDSLDPAASAIAQIEIMAGLERHLLEIRSRMASIEGAVDDNAPSLNALRRQADALEKQIREKSGGMEVAGGDQDLSLLLAKYEELQVEKMFSQKAYTSALASLETARIEAGRQQRYLAVYNKPALPEFPLYPRKVLYPVLFLVVSVGLWGIGTLIIYAVRDHLS